MDFHSIAPDAGLDPETRALFGRVIDAHHAAPAERHSFDPFAGRVLDRALSSVGLAEVESEGRLSIWRGGQPGGTVWRLTLIQLREQLIAHGRVAAAEVDTVIDICDDLRLAFMSQATIAAWATGRNDTRRGAGVPAHPAGTVNLRIRTSEPVAS